MRAEEETSMTTTAQEQESGIHVATPEEGRALFDYQARKVMNMSGPEFLERWDAGEFRDFTDTPEHWPLMSLIMLIPFARDES